MYGKNCGGKAFQMKFGTYVGLKVQKKKTLTVAESVLPW